MDQEDDVKLDHMGGKGMGWLDQVIPALDPLGGASGQLYTLEGRVGNCGRYKGMYGDYMCADDVLKEGWIQYRGRRCTGVDKYSFVQKSSVKLFAFT